ncbi:MAG: ribosomal protein S18-alanine N-acetyltransferase [Burkholderiaceae bacterium]|nr:ribosomal protein S18-alanine N-acetyltransferase [Burkholderiaceae bacterium]
MNALASHPHDAPQVRLEALALDQLERVLAIEAQAYEFPWSRGNFTDSLASGCAVHVLRADEQVLGYYVAMRGVDETHLLNLTVAPQFQRQGWARALLDALVLWARAQGSQWLWLEVRASNRRALRVYQAFGFRRVGGRPRYYPAAGGAREDAIVMSLAL